MKSLTKSLKEIFAPLAAALFVAAPLLTASAPAHAVMNQGPTRLIFQQLDREGYDPVGAGYSQGGPGGAVSVVTFFGKENGEWLVTKGNESTARVIARGDNLQVGQWAYLVDVSNDSQKARLQNITHESGCLPFEQIEKNVLKRAFSTSDVIEGRMSNGSTMKTFVNEGKWLSMTVRGDEQKTTCRQDGGSGFLIANPPAPVSFQ